MSERQKQALEAIIEKVNPARRAFLRRVLIGSATVAFAAPMSALLAQTADPDAGDGKGKGKGRGGKGKGGGEGKGKGQGEGKGRGKGGGAGKGKGRGRGN